MLVQVFRGIGLRFGTKNNPEIPHATLNKPSPVLWPPLNPEALIGLSLHTYILPWFGQRAAWQWPVQ